MEPDQAGFTDPIQGAEIMRLLDVTPATFKDIIELSKVQEVAGFFGQFSDASFIVQSTLSRKRNPSITNIDHMFNYVKLRKELMQTDDRRERLRKELSFFE
jgi:hypothetical protein